jgi:hypothetical protein
MTIKNVVEYKNRQVEIVEIDGVDPRDYPDFCDAYVFDAVWVDTGESLTDVEMEDITDLHGDVVNEMAHDQLF